MSICAENTSRAINGLELASNKLAEFFNEMDSGGVSRGHLFWAIPANTLLNMVTLVMAPIVALVQLIAAIVFEIIGCCSAAAKECARGLFVKGLHALIDTPATAVTRIFYPIFKGAECMSEICSLRIW